MLGLFGDLLIVDSIHGFMSFGYHVMNVTPRLVPLLCACMKAQSQFFEFIKSLDS